MLSKPFLECLAYVGTIPWDFRPSESILKMISQNCTYICICIASNSQKVKLNFQPVKNENIYLLVLSHSWLRTIYIGQIIQKFTKNPIIWSSKIGK